MPTPQDDAAQDIDESEQRQAEQGSQQYGGEDFIGALLRPGHVHYRAESLAADKFTDDRADDGKPAGDTESGKDLGEGGWEAQLPKCGQRRGPVEAEEVAQSRVGGEDAIEGVGDHGKDRSEERR